MKVCLRCNTQRLRIFGKYRGFRATSASLHPLSALDVSTWTLGTRYKPWYKSVATTVYTLLAYYPKKTKKTQVHSRNFDNTLAHMTILEIKTAQTNNANAGFPYRTRYKTWLISSDSRLLLTKKGDLERLSLKLPVAPFTWVPNYLSGALCTYSLVACNPYLEGLTPETAGIRGSQV